MITIPMLVLALQVQQQAPNQTSPVTLDPPMGIEQPVDAAPAPDPYAGSFAAGMNELAELSRAGSPDEALAVAERLLVPTTLARWRASLESLSGGVSEKALAKLERPLTWFGLQTMDAADRAEVHYAMGLVHVQQGTPEAADAGFELARALAGPGATRADATYNLGNIDLLVGEVLRAKIPEISGQQPAPPAGQQPGQPPGQHPGQPQEEEPDPIDLARAAYIMAKDHFVERLRMDWADEDTRANMELVMRRLKELDEIERQREEQEEEQQQQGDDQEKSDEQDSEDSDEKQDGEQSEDDSQEQKDNEEQQDESKEGEDKPEEEQEEEQPEEQEGEQDEEQEENGEERDAEPQPEEKHLTAEEVQRLLEQMQAIDEKGEELRARIKGQRRVPVKKDW